MKTQIIGITGGIGTGKSVVSRILRLRGEHVYDCDSEAKRLMDNSVRILSALNDRYGDEVCPREGPICRKALADRIFRNDDERLWLNTLVHGEVLVDVAAWHDSIVINGDSGRCFVESAILASSGLIRLCDEAWLISAPEDIRIARIRSRDSLDDEAIRSRILSQSDEEKLILASGLPVRVIQNSPLVPLLTSL